MQSPIITAMNRIIFLLMFTGSVSEYASSTISPLGVALASIMAVSSRRCNRNRYSCCFTSCWRFMLRNSRSCDGTELNLDMAEFIFERSSRILISLFSYAFATEPISTSRIASIFLSSNCSDLLLGLALVARFMRKISKSL